MTIQKIDLSELEVFEESVDNGAAIGAACGLGCFGFGCGLGCAGMGC